MDLKLPGILGPADIPDVSLSLLHADAALSMPIYHCGDAEHQGQVKMFADFAFEVIPSAHLAISTHDEKGHKKAIIKATEPTDTICLVFKAIGTCRKSKHHTLETHSSFADYVPQV